MGSTRPGKHTQFAIEAMAIENTGFTQLENGDFPQLCKRLPEGTTVDGCEILHLGWQKSYTGIKHLSTGAGFLPSTVSQKCTVYNITVYYSVLQCIIVTMKDDHI